MWVNTILINHLCISTFRAFFWGGSNIDCWIYLYEDMLMSKYTVEQDLSLLQSEGEYLK